MQFNIWLQINFVTVGKSALSKLRNIFCQSNKMSIHHEVPEYARYSSTFTLKSILSHWGKSIWSKLGNQFCQSDEMPIYHEVPDYARCRSPFNCKFICQSWAINYGTMGNQSWGINFVKVMWCRSTMKWMHITDATFTWESVLSNSIYFFLQESYIYVKQKSSNKAAKYAKRKSKMSSSSIKQQNQ